MNTRQMALEALKLSASALEEHTTSAESNRCTYCCRIGICSQECVVRIACESAQTAINILEADLAPVAWAVYAMVDGEMVIQWPVPLSLKRAQEYQSMYEEPAVTEIRELYAAPQEAVAPIELTDAEIVSIAYDCNALPECITDKTLLTFARAAIAKAGGAA